MGPYEDFYSLLAKLKEKNQKFDSRTLKKLTYNQLDLAAIGNAGTSKCSPTLVSKEKSLRRQEYLLKDSIDSDRDYLESIGMLEEVMEERNKIGPMWEDLSTILKLWFKLNCLETHLDSPNIRITEVLKLLKECESEGSLPHQLVATYVTEFQSILLLSHKLNEDTIRNVCNQCSYAIKEFLNLEDSNISNNKIISNYSCSSYCFRSINEL